MANKTFISIGISVIYIFSCCLAEKESCSINIKKQIPRNEPVYIVEKSNRRMELYEPEGDSIEIKSPDKLILFCPGNGNKIFDSNDNANELSCARNFQNKLHESNCTKQVTGDLQTTSRECALGNRKGLIYRSGFAIENSFVESFEMCYDSQTASALYSHHQIIGKAIKYAIKEGRRVNFKIDGIPKRAKAEMSYRKQTQINHFKKVLGRNQNYFTNSSFLSRGHLAPDADFIFTSGQFATYFYANVCPQFQTINGGNWVRVESWARQIAEQEEFNLDIYTGVLGHLALPSSGGDLVPLYLSDSNQIEVPEYFWKIIYNSRTDAAVVFITMNNPFASRSDVRNLCSDVCNQIGITFKQNARRGFTQCCSYADFSRIVTPQSLKVNRLLVLNN